MIFEVSTIYRYYWHIMKLLRTIAEVIFILIHPIFKPAPVQLFLARFIALPYSMTKYLNFRGVVPFMVKGRKLIMQSYNTPIEITVFWRGIFSGREGSELSIWSKLSQGADVALDIGANNGIYALVSSVEPKIKIHAFEPVPQVYEMLMENIGLNKTNNIVPHQAVVSNTNGQQTLFVPNEGWVDVASLNQEFASQYTEGRELVEIECKAVTIDQFLIDQKISDTDRVICKIDVEGGEPLVLQGAKNTIAEKNIIFLIEALDEKAFEEIRPYFPSNYQIYGVDSRHHKLFKTTVSSDLANNYLFLKQVPFGLLEEVSL